MTSRVSSAFALVLIFLVVLGHVCELPLSAMAAPHAHEGDHHDGSDHHADDSEVACDAVLGVPPTIAHSSLGLDISAYEHPVVPTAALQIVFGTVPRSDTVRSRPPLFLMHAALLI